MSLNASATQIVEQMQRDAASLRITSSKGPLGETLIDAGAKCIGSIEAGRSVRPYGADFEDGYRAALICDAIANSAATGRVAAVAPAGAVPSGARS